MLFKTVLKASLIIRTFVVGISEASGGDPGYLKNSFRVVIIWSEMATVFCSRMSTSVRYASVSAASTLSSHFRSALHWRISVGNVCVQLPHHRLISTNCTALSVISSQCHSASTQTTEWGSDMWSQINKLIQSVWYMTEMKHNSMQSCLLLSF